MQFKGKTIDGKPATQWEQIQAQCVKYPEFTIDVRKFDEQREISDGQRAWLKGILLPALAKDNGDSVECWETRLKLAVMPDEFKAEIAIIDNRPYCFVPSITKLSCKKMNQLIEGSVAKLHEWGFMWVTLPDKELAKG